MVASPTAGLSLPVPGTFNLSCVFRTLVESERIKAMSGSCWLDQTAATHWLNVGVIGALGARHPEVSLTCNV